MATFYYRQTAHDFSQVLNDLGDGRFEYKVTATSAQGHAAGVDLSVYGNLSSTLSYSASLSPYWNQIDAGNLVGASVGTRSTFSAGGRANLNWQVRPDDTVQLNTIFTGERLQAQGVLEPVLTLNMGWRHKISNRLTANVTGQGDLLASTRFRRILDTPTLVERLDPRPVASDAWSSSGSTIASVAAGRRPSRTQVSSTRTARSRRA